MLPTIVFFFALLGSFFTAIVLYAVCTEDRVRQFNLTQWLTVVITAMLWSWLFYLLH